MCNKFNEISLAHLINGDDNSMKDRNIIRIYINTFRLYYFYLLL